MRTVVLSAAALAWATLCAAAPLPPRAIALPAKVLEELRRKRFQADRDVRSLKRDIQEAAGEAERQKIAEKVRRSERMYYDLVLGFLCNLRDCPELVPDYQVAPEERPALEKAIKWYGDELREAVHKGAASPERQAEPQLPLQFRLASRRFDAEYRQGVGMEAAAALAWGMSHEELEYRSRRRELNQRCFVKKHALLKEIDEDPRAALGYDLSSEEKEVVKRSLVGIADYRDLEVKLGRCAAEPQYAPPARKK
jgi:hypothetical protein